MASPIGSSPYRCELCRIAFGPQKDEQQSSETSEIKIYFNIILFLFLRDTPQRQIFHSFNELVMK